MVATALLLLPFTLPSHMHDATTLLRTGLLVWLDTTLTFALLYRELA